MVSVECVVDSRSELGEATTWDPREQVLCGVDIKSRLIHRYDIRRPAEHRTFAAPHDLGCLAVRERGGLVVTMSDGFLLLRPGDRRVREDRRPGGRICRKTGSTTAIPDRQGRFWSGTMHDATAAKTGSLYRLDADLTCHKVFEGVVCSNALA